MEPSESSYRPQATVEAAAKHPELPPAQARLGTLIGFAAATFLGAFLLFQVQPLIGKYILPWFGGGPAG